MHYLGAIDPETRERNVYRIADSGPRIPLNPRFDLRNHSPTGFHWGYGGSGPAQLALAVLADYLRNDEVALLRYQEFKWQVIAALPQNDGWTLHPEDIEAAVGNGATS
jgi:Family of unknown function (DUF6166)